MLPPCRREFSVSFFKRTRGDEFCIALSLDQSLGLLVEDCRKSHAIASRSNSISKFARISLASSSPDQLVNLNKCAEVEPLANAHLGRADEEATMAEAKLTT